MITPNSRGFVKDAIYLSHTSLRDFAKCPRAYYLKNLYKDPVSGRKLHIASPYLTLGVTIHDSISWFCSQEVKPTKEELIQQFRKLWLKYHKKHGGFTSLDEEALFGKRGLEMLDNFYDNSKALKPFVKPVQFPKHHLLDDVILIGNTDYVGLADDGTLEIVDFKTGIKDEDTPLQLYIYAILCEANLQREVSSVAFWYLDRHSEPRQVVLDPLETTLTWLQQEAIKVKEAVTRNDWTCKKAPFLCRDCREYEALINGLGEFLYADLKFKKDIYFLDRSLLPIPAILDEQTDDAALES